MRDQPVTVLLIHDCVMFYVHTLPVGRELVDAIIDAHGASRDGHDLMILLDELTPDRALRFSITPHHDDGCVYKILDAGTARSDLVVELRRLPSFPSLYDLRDHAIDVVRTWAGSRDYGFIEHCFDSVRPYGQNDEWDDHA